MDMLILLTIGLLSLLRGSQQLAERVIVPSISNDPVSKGCSAPNTDYEKSTERCCSKCPPGTFKVKSCSNDQDTQCELCRPGSYTEVWNFISGCLSCRGLCKAELGLIQLQECTATTKRKCVCGPGTYCKSKVDESDTTCSHCVQHSSCPPGQGVRISGNYNANTVCTTCPAGAFSNVSSATQRCQTHTDCLALRKLTARPGNASADAECLATTAGILGRSGDKHGDSTSVSLAVLSAILFIIVVTTGFCLLQGLRKQRPLQLACFKKVFKRCISDPEAQTTDDTSPDALRGEQLLCPSEFAQQQTTPVALTSPPLESEVLQERPCEPKAAADRSTIQSGESTSGSREEGQTLPNQGTVKLEGGGDKPTGIIGPVYIYNPSRVYVGVISNQRASQRSLAARDRPAPNEGTLRYPQEEQGTSVRETGHVPQQECGKEYHLPESVSEEP
ncbi:tumor necrosis factor receptor superfamily member 3-like [Scyliorhinus torazame]|uniref:tumor necrosis factor receptor superfamily member 3-like n=1 Tax=Scyliorhinus torazame TaxID=75743 RepID=UPI003B59AF0C